MGLSPDTQMNTLILILLILATSLLGAYTISFQETTLYFGKKLASSKSLSKILQNAITPYGQNVRNIVYPGLNLVILVYGLVFYKWYLAVGFLIFTFFIATPILRSVLPKTKSDFYRQKIRKDLLKKQTQYKKSGDGERETAATELLVKFDKL